VKDLVREFNEYAELDIDTENISPEILGVVFTMIQITSGQPIAAQRQFMSQTKRLGVKTFDTYFRENKTLFADAPQNLKPVVLNYYSAGTHSDVVTEIEEFVTEFESTL
jgi:chromosome partitioning protein